MGGLHTSCAMPIYAQYESTMVVHGPVAAHLRFSLRRRSERLLCSDPLRFPRRFFCFRVLELLLSDESTTVLNFEPLAGCPCSSSDSLWCLFHSLSESSD
jgi:hypothetical protein